MEKHSDNSAMFASKIGALAVYAALCMTACEALPDSSPDTKWETITNTRFLPTNARPGNREALPARTQLELLKKGWGYSVVRTESGRTGEVPSEDLGIKVLTHSPLDQLKSREWTRASPTHSYPTYQEVGPKAEAAPAVGVEGESFPPVEPELPQWEDGD